MNLFVSIAVTCPTCNATRTREQVEAVSYFTMRENDAAVAREGRERDPMLLSGSFCKYDHAAAMLRRIASALLHEADRWNENAVEREWFAKMRDEKER